MVWIQCVIGVVYNVCKCAIEVGSFMSGNYLLAMLCRIYIYKYIYICFVCFRAVFKYHG